MGGMDPAMMQAMQQMAMGGAGGKGGGKKAEQQLLDTKLWINQYLLVLICQKMGINLPPAVVIGPPPDPMAMASAQQDQQMAQGAGAPMPGDQGAAGGAGGNPAPIPPVQPMDASQGPIGQTKQGELEPTFGTEFSTQELDSFIGTVVQNASAASKMRRFVK
jgi:hypothetical protein